MAIGSMEDILESLAIPMACRLDKPLFKKMFLEEGALNAADKVSLKDDIDRIRWLYTLKPGTINIAPYVDKEREYDEVAILLVELSNQARYKRIAHFIQRSIPYPLVLIFTCENDGVDHLAISVADKRVNQADKEKWVIEDSIHTDWIDLTDPSPAETEFLYSIAINNLSFKNFWEFYKTLTERVIAINCSIHSGEFRLDDGKKNSGEDRLAMLRNIEKLNDEKASIANKLKKERQMGKQVELNTQIKKIDDKLKRIRSSL